MEIEKALAKVESLPPKMIKEAKKIVKKYPYLSAIIIATIAYQTIKDND